MKTIILVSPTTHLSSEVVVETFDNISTILAKNNIDANAGYEIRVNNIVETDKSKVPMDGDVILVSGKPQGA